MPDGYAGFGGGGSRGGFGSSNSLRSQDRGSDGGHASTSGFSGFEDAHDGELALCCCICHAAPLSLHTEMLLTLHVLSCLGVLCVFKCRELRSLSGAA